MKITIKILENVVNEEKTDPEQSFAPPVSAEQLRQEPIAAYIMQTLNRQWPTLASQSELDILQGRVAELEGKINNKRLNQNQNSTYAGDTDIKELKQIIAQETVTTIMEQSDCKQIRLEDLEQIEELFDNICELLDDFIDKKREMLSPEENVTIDADTLRTTDKEMPADIPSEQSHEVVAGDTFWELARTYLGNPLRWKEIMNANMGLLKNRPKRKFKNTPEAIPVIRPGDMLTIPSRS